MTEGDSGFPGNPHGAVTSVEQFQNDGYFLLGKPRVVVSVGLVPLSRLAVGTFDDGIPGIRPLVTAFATFVVTAILPCPASAFGTGAGNHLVVARPPCVTAIGTDKISPIHEVVCESGNRDHTVRFSHNDKYCGSQTDITETDDTDTMKVFVYNYRRFDEEGFFLKYTKEFGMELAFTEEAPVIGNCALADGCDFVSVITTPVTAGMLDRFKQGGVKMVSTRTIGYDHIDLEHAKEIGMAISHITYDPEGVAEYTVMEILMAVRGMKNIMRKTMENDFTLNGMIAGELREMSVGIIGSGRIGKSVLRDLSGFGCKLFYHNRNRSEEAEKYAEYLPLNELLARCDVISLHLELNGETEHIVGKDALSRMKKGAVLVNTARGPLVDTSALIDSLKNGHLGYAALDVVENEFGLFYNDKRDTDLENHFLGILRKMDNVLVTHHMAFYYRSAVRDMVCNCLYGMKMLNEGKEVPLRLA